MSLSDLHAQKEHWQQGWGNHKTVENPIGYVTWEVVLDSTTISCSPVTVFVCLFCANIAKVAESTSFHARRASPMAVSSANIDLFTATKGRTVRMEKTKTTAVSMLASWRYSLSQTHSLLKQDTFCLTWSEITNLASSLSMTHPSWDTKATSTATVVSILCTPTKDRFNWKWLNFPQLSSIWLTATVAVTLITKKKHIVNIRDSLRFQSSFKSPSHLCKSSCLIQRSLAFVFRRQLTILLFDCMSLLKLPWMASTGTWITTKWTSSTLMSLILMST